MQLQDEFNVTDVYGPKNGVASVVISDGLFEVEIELSDGELECTVTGSDTGAVYDTLDTVERFAKNSFTVL